MKKHRSFKHIEKEEKKTKGGMYLAIFIAVIMVGGIGGIIIGNMGGDSEYSYGKYSFTSKNNLWVTKINKQNIVFYFLPQEVDYLEVSNPASQLLKKSSGIIITYDPEINETPKLQAIDIFKAELTDTMINNNKQAVFALTKAMNTSAFPVITCANSTYLFPVVSIEYGNETKTELNNECIVVSASDAKNLMVMMDNIRYRIYGVIDEET